MKRDGMKREQRWGRNQWVGVLQSLKSLVVSVLLCAFGHASLLAQDPGGVVPPTLPDSVQTITLTGTVTDLSSGLPILVAAVKVPDLGLVVFTNPNGTFRFLDFPVGTWDIVVEQLGYHTIDSSVAIAPGVDLTVRLRPNPVALAGITVQARSQRLLSERRRRIPYRVVVLDAESLLNTIAISPGEVIRRHANGKLLPCGDGVCVPSKGKLVQVSLFIDEIPAMGGWWEFDALSVESLAHVEFIPCLGMVRVFTKRFMTKMDQGRMEFMDYFISGPCK